MSVVNKSALVSYSPEQMYALVNDVEAYSRFLPWCRSSQVLERSEDRVKASIEIARGKVRKSFTTLNRMYPPERIELHLLEGPFSRLEGAWRFQPLQGGGCKVMLHLEFEFSNPLLRAAVGPVFNRIADTMVDAFCQRAKQVYG
ncbi:MAG: type II toxin-antitoxin system RatA family toxin [Candidatus Competibacterales bacterium]|nr:type II toxin-antitoxin system RatA family toxin [Candidatus Competibacterales bacterium]